MEKVPSSFNLESNEDPEDIVITSREQAIIDAVTPEDVEVLRSLKKENLGLESKDIVGIRAEDFFYFIQAVHNGYLPVGKSDIRDKRGSIDHIFLIPNAQSEYLQQDRQDLYSGISKKDVSFAKISDDTVNLYGTVPISQGVYRNLWDRVSNKENFLVSEFRETPNTEAYFEMLASEVRHSRNLDCTSDRYELSHLLHSNLDPAVPRVDVNKLLRSLKDRSGILLAFNKKIIEKGISATVDDETVLDLAGEELAIAFEDGRIPLDAIVGYEVLGDFEDEIERRIGVTQ